MHPFVDRSEAVESDPDDRQASGAPLFLDVNDLCTASSGLRGGVNQKPCPDKVFLI